MKWLRAVVMAGVLVLVLTVPSYAAITNLILNGSFESSDVAPGELGPVGGWEVYTSPTTGLEWIPISPYGMEIQDHVVGEPGQAWEAYDGDQLAELDIYPGQNGGMYQTVDTISGQMYNLSFALSPRPGVPPSSSGILLYWNDGLIDTLTTDGSGLVNTSWSIVQYSLTAEGTSSTLKFLATGTADGGGSFIDDVQLSPVPIPPTIYLMGSGLVGLVGIRRRMRKR